MNIDLTQANQQTMLSIDGELDRDTLSVNLFESLSAKDKQQVIDSKHIEINLSKVARADTSGLAWLLNALRDLRAHGVDVSVTNIPQKLIDLAKLSNADTLITS